VALLADGSVRAWGRNDFDQCGVPEDIGRVSHVAASALTTVIAIADEAACPADLDGNGTVTGADLGLLLGDWGTPGTANGSDLTGDGVVTGADLGILLGNWGACG
jgi:hypothetical protein